MTFEGPGPGWDLKGLLWGTILYFFGGLQKKKRGIQTRFLLRHWKKKQSRGKKHAKTLKWMTVQNPSWDKVSRNY